MNSPYNTPAMRAQKVREALGISVRESRRRRAYQVESEQYVRISPQARRRSE